MGVTRGIVGWSVRLGLRCDYNENSGWEMAS